MPRRRSLLTPALQGVRRFLLEHELDSFPLRDTIKRYSVWKFRQDFIAALNVAMPAIPQGMAYAMMAGLSGVSAGIMASAVAAIIAPLFCSSRHVVLGPTNATALMLASVLTAHHAVATASILPLLVFFAGLLLVTGAWLRMADLIQYVSRSVVVGYLAGAGLVIMASQFREVLSMSDMGGRTFFTRLADTLGRLDEASLLSFIVAVLTAVIYFLTRKFAPRYPAFAIALIVMSVAMAVMSTVSTERVPTLAPFTAGDLVPSIPDFTSTGTLDLLSSLLGPAMALAFLIALENTVMAKSLASRSGDRPDLNQDMLAAGIANLGCAFTGAMPASGSPIRSTINMQAGAQTPLASLYCGVLCLIAAFFTGPLVKYVPRPALAALIICVAGGLINLRQLRICFRATASDAATVLVTLLSTLLAPLHVAIFVGVATSIVLYLRKASRPMLVEYEFNPDGALTERDARGQRQNPAISIVHVEGELFFGAAELFRTQIQRTVRDPNLRIIILRMKNARHLDATSVMALEELITFLRSKQRHLIISGLSRDVYRVLRNAGMIEVIGRENIFMGSTQNPNLSTRNALKRAQALLGGAKADVQIWYDPNQPRDP